MGDDACAEFVSGAFETEADVRAVCGCRTCVNRQSAKLGRQDAPAGGSGDLAFILVEERRAGRGQMKNMRHDYEGSWTEQNPRYPRSSGAPMTNACPSIQLSSP